MVVQLTGCHSHMLNVTARLAIRINHLPDFPFRWSDTEPQCCRQSLTINFYLPNKEEATNIQEHGVHYLMGFLVDHFPDLENLRQYVPPFEPLHPPQKTDVVPMKVLFKDEKLKTDTIDILSQLIDDANLDGTPQVYICRYKCIHDILHMCTRIHVAFHK